MTEMAINRQTVNKNSNELAKGLFAKRRFLAKMACLVEMAEMAINSPTVNKNSNEVSKGPFGKWRF